MGVSVSIALGRTILDPKICQEKRFVSVKEMRYEVCFNTDQLVDALEVGRRELLAT